VTGEELAAQFDAITRQLSATVRSKNADYAGIGSAFSNFESIETVSAGAVTAEQGILVRLSDKLSRIANLLGVDHAPFLALLACIWRASDGAVIGESFEDTCLDTATYFILMALLHRSRI
jgi:hypothetical protein